MLGIRTATSKFGCTAGAKQHKFGRTVLDRKEAAAMAGDEASDGPSMTEILASIKRIIAEDDGDDAKDTASGTASQAEQAEVVELYAARDDIKDAEVGDEDEISDFAEDDTLELTAMVEDDGTIVSLEDTPVADALAEHNPAEDVPPPGDIVVDMNAAPPPIDAIEVPSSLLRPDEDGAETDALAAEIEASEIQPEVPDDGFEIEEAEALIPIEDDALVSNATSDEAEKNFWIDERSNAGESDETVTEAPPTERPDAEASESVAVKKPVRDDRRPKEILSAETAAAAGAAFAQLAESSKPTGQSVDEMVRELLRPLLQEWLDENLPPLVEKMIDREISRISGRDDVP